MDLFWSFFHLLSMTFLKSRPWYFIKLVAACCFFAAAKPRLPTNYIFLYRLSIPSNLALANQKTTLFSKKWPAKCQFMFSNTWRFKECSKVSILFILFIKIWYTWLSQTFLSIPSNQIYQKCRLKSIPDHWQKFQDIF